MKKKYKDEPLSDSRPIIPLVILGLFVSGMSVLLAIEVIKIIPVVSNIVGIAVCFLPTVLLLWGLVLFFTGIRWPKFIRKNFY